MRINCLRCNSEINIQPAESRTWKCPKCFELNYFDAEERCFVTDPNLDADWKDYPSNNLRGQGLRYNENKTPFECVPLHLLEGCAKVFKHVTERGEKPYPMWNWARGMDWSKPYACALRHLEDWYRGEDNDNETGLNHLHHVMCNILMLIHYTDAYLEGDDRPKEYFQPGGIKAHTDPSNHQ